MRNNTTALEFCAAWWLLLGSLPGATHTAELPSSTNSVLLEAEQFNRLGGWVIDAQFMDQMGSPFLLAHGLGRPVANAETTVEFPATGAYHVLVRTRDWVAAWKAPGAPGRFQVLVNGTALAKTFGTEGAAWHWQDGGTVEIASKRSTIALHDLTGFEGRCDAILFTRLSDFTPPNREPELAAFRRQLLSLPEKPEEAGEFDLVVVGGGIAGTCAAVSGARLGLSVAFIQDRPVLGGNNSSEVRVWLQGARNQKPFPRVGDVVKELEQQNAAHYGPANRADLYEDEKKIALVQAEPKIRLFLNHRANAVEKSADRMTAVLAQDVTSGRRFRFAGQWFADCTGDAAIGFLAGADFDVTPKGHMGPCNLWNVLATDQAVPFPRCPWALDLTNRPFPGREKPKPDTLKLGGWYWESGFDREPMEEMEYVRDWNFRAMYGAWDALKNVDKVLPNHKLNWAAYVLGKRESRRLLGDFVLTKEDLLQSKAYPDGCVPTGWKIDLHLPDQRYEKGFEGDAFIAQAQFTSYKMPYWVPYRCLYSRNVPNLFMAGRNISVTHEALGTVRVQRTTGMMGEIVGMAAALCKKHEADPRAVSDRYLNELKELMSRGVGKNPGGNPADENEGDRSSQNQSPAQITNTPPDWLKNAGPNLARTAQVSVSGSKDTAQSPPALLTDGKIDLRDNSQRWLSDNSLPQHVEFAWDKPQTIRAARVISGYCPAGGSPGWPVSAFVWQYHDGTTWRDISGASAQANLLVDWSAQFPPVVAARLRLLITATHQNISRIWEIELYGAE